MNSDKKKYFNKIIMLLILLFFCYLLVIKDYTSAKIVLGPTLLFIVVANSDIISHFQFKDLKLELQDAVNKVNVTTEHMQNLMRYVIDYQIKSLDKVGYFSKASGEDARAIHNLMESAQFDDTIFVNESKRELDRIIAKNIHSVLRSCDLLNIEWDTFETYDGVRYPYPEEMFSYVNSGKYSHSKYTDYDPKPNLVDYDDDFSYLFIEKDKRAC